MASGCGTEEDYFLKQAFSALVPAFDPRPGRTNVPQIQDFHVPSPGSEEARSTSNQTLFSPSHSVKLALSIRVRVQHKHFKKLKKIFLILLLFFLEW